MSIMSEYEKIKNELGEDVFNKIEVYLDFHPDIFLSDVLYNKQNFDSCMQWYENAKDDIKDNPKVFGEFTKFYFKDFNSDMKYELALIDDKYVYYIDEMESDDNVNTLMMDLDKNIVSDNYFACESLFETMIAISSDLSAFQSVSFMSESCKTSIEEMKKEREQEIPVGALLKANANNLVGSEGVKKGEKFIVLEYINADDDEVYRGDAPATENLYRIAPITSYMAVVACFEDTSNLGIYLNCEQIKEKFEIENMKVSSINERIDSAEKKSHRLNDSSEKESLRKGFEK